MDQIVMSEPRLVYAAPVNEATAQWGVYAIPKLWRLPCGELVVYANGKKDTPGSPRLCPDLFFLSGDGGKTWTPTPKREDIDTGILGNVEFPYLKLASGNTLCLKPAAQPAPVTGIEPVNKFPIPNAPIDLYYTYRQGSLTGDMFALQRIIYAPDGSVLDSSPVRFDFDEREIIVIGQLRGKETGYALSVHNCNGSPYITSLTALGDGTLLGLCVGNKPGKTGRYCGEAYLVESTDEGLSWRLRSVITKNAASYPFGLCGDGLEASLTAAPDGTLYCVTRMNMSLGDSRPGVPVGTMMFVSHDRGFTWEDERLVADSSVTPHVIAFKNGAIAVIYGRPGVHMIVSDDGGRTFSKPYSVIGPTRSEENAAGKSFSEGNRFDISYSNSFYVMQDDETILLLYTDMSYDPGDGLKHKAGLVRRIAVRAR